MEEPQNICEILEIAAEDQWQHGLLINLPSGLERDTTEHSRYEVAFNHKDQSKEPEKFPVGKHNKESKDSEERLSTGWISYKTLLNNARAESHVIEALMNIHNTEIVLICTDNQLDYIQ